MPSATTDAVRAAWLRRYAAEWHDDALLDRERDRFDAWLAEVENRAYRRGFDAASGADLPEHIGRGW